jgi:serine/threonine protein kinase
MENFTGQSFGRYNIHEPLGEGGMATVYRAYDTRLERDVAIKIIRKGAFPLDHIERILKRFEREAKALGRLSHPNIMKVHDYGEHEGSPYLVMEYIQGGTLKEKMGKPLPWREAIQILQPIAEALDYAHSQNMIHRDVKPSNILLTQRGQPMLTDFGIAKILDLEDTQDLTGTSAAMGTPEYMSPEQATAKNVDHRADIYSLGIVLYEMVTGRKPFVADTPMAILIKHATDPLPRPRQFEPSLPDNVEKVLLKALAKKPDERYQNMGEMVSAFEKLLIDRGKQPIFAAKPKEDKKAPKTNPEIKLPVKPEDLAETPIPVKEPSKGINRKLVMGILGALLTISLCAWAGSLIVDGWTAPAQTPTATVTITPGETNAPALTLPSTSTPTLTPVPTQTSTATLTPTSTPIPPPTLKPTKEKDSGGGGGGICLSIHTQIDTPRGLVAVEDLRVGDLVWTVDASGARVSAVILRTAKTSVPASHQMVHVTLSDGRELWASPGHPTADGRTLGMLGQGDLLDGARIIQAERVIYDQPATYDILPAGATGFYWADGILIGSTLTER